MVPKELIRSILGWYTLPWEGTHGVPHWARVLENGRRLSEATGARGERINEGVDKLARENTGGANQNPLTVSQILV